MHINFDENILFINEKQVKIKNKIIHAEKLNSGILVITDRKSLSDELQRTVIEVGIYDFNGNYSFVTNKAFRTCIYYTKYNIEIMNNHKVIILYDLFGIKYSIDLESFDIIRREGVLPHFFVATWHEIQIGGKTIKFENEIEKLIQLNNQIIISLSNMKTGDVTKQPRDGIYSINKDGDILWNIKDITQKCDNIYGGIFVKKYGDKLMLVVTDVIGIKYTVDLNNNTVIKKEGYK